MTTWSDKIFQDSYMIQSSYFLPFEWVWLYLSAFSRDYWFSMRSSLDSLIRKYKFDWFCWCKQQQFYRKHWNQVTAFIGQLLNWLWSGLINPEHRELARMVWSSCSWRCSFDPVTDKNTDTHTKKLIWFCKTLLSVEGICLGRRRVWYCPQLHGIVHHP